MENAHVKPESGMFDSLMLTTIFPLRRRHVCNSLPPPPPQGSAVCYGYYSLLNLSRISLLKGNTS